MTMLHLLVQEDADGRCRVLGLYAATDEGRAQAWATAWRDAEQWSWRGVSAWVQGPDTFGNHFATPLQATSAAIYRLLNMGAPVAVA